MTSLSTLTIADARSQLKAKKISSRELTQDCLTAIAAAAELNAFCHVTAEAALQQAEAADQRLKSPDAPDLCGIPLGIKDLFCTYDVTAEPGQSSPLGLFKGKLLLRRGQRLADRHVVEVLPGQVVLVKIANTANRFVRTGCQNREHSDQ